MTDLATLWRELADENRLLAAELPFSEPFVALAETCLRHAERAAYEAERTIRWEEDA